MKRKLLTLIKMFASSAITFVLIFFNYTISYSQNLTKSNPADDFWIEIETSGENFKALSLVQLIQFMPARNMVSS